MTESDGTMLKNPLMTLVMCLFVLMFSKTIFAQEATSEPAPVRNSDPQVVHSFSGEAQRIWDEYVFSTVNGRALQQGCEPVQFKPSPAAQFKGVIILLHGFTSCPKQYWTMAAEFSARGFHVLLPLLPGHGGLAVDELDAQYSLPRATNWFVYDSFARWLNELAKKVSGAQVHIGGLCLGGTIAARAMQLEPALYARSVLFSPFFEVSARMLGRIGRLFGRTADVLNLREGLGLPVALSDLETCEGIERKKMGRAGYCRTRLDNLIAVARFGYFVKSQMRRIQTQIQTIVVENDPVAHPRVTLELIEDHTQLGPARNSVCVMNESATHSFFSTTDLPMPKPWLSELHSEIVEFFESEKNIIVGKPSVYAWPTSGGAVASCSLWP